MKQIPRTIDPAKTFKSLVNWLTTAADQLNAPGFLVGLSGTDSLVAFCAAAEAMAKLNKPHRIMGVHFAPSEDFLYDHPEAEVHLWFANEVVPWLKKKYPKADIVIDTSIDWRADGQRWGTLMDMSVVFNGRKRTIRLPEDQYWVLGTRNRTEGVLHNYSNVSMAVSIQPLIDLWKSEILELSEYLDIPQIAIQKSCETDCICGRMRLPAQHITEVDQLLMSRVGELSPEYVENKIPSTLRLQLNNFINEQINKNAFKVSIPLRPLKDATVEEVSFNDDLVKSFEDGSIKLNEFNHYKHLYIAWVYLKTLAFEVALERYCAYLKVVLNKNNQSRRYNVDITSKYFVLVVEAMQEYPLESFDGLVQKYPKIMQKISA